jgi:phosphoglycerol transferase MdoB-like AlkP superfamily enzyme
MNFNTYLGHLWSLFKRIAFILVLFTIARLIFFLVNLSVFKPLDVSQIVKSFFYGIRFDFIAVFYLNLVFISFHLFCFQLLDKSIFRKILKGLFIFVNAVLLLFNIIDIVYFKYTGKRSGWEMIEMLQTSTDTTEMLPVYLAHYWYLALLLIAFIYLIIRFYPRYRAIKISVSNSLFNKWVFIYSLSILFILSGIAFARGMEIKPIRLITANRYVTPDHIPLLLNTPFVVINTVNQHSEKIQDFLPFKEVSRYYTSLHRPDTSDKFNKMNVVIIILESFGKEYMEAKTEKGEAFTPFLDSLQSVGLNCTNAFANAKRSIDALPPILGGFPSLLQTSFLGSAYSINKLRGLPAILKEQGYSSSFYHGGKNGTMGFDMFCKSLGIDKYYGREEYNNENDYDGAWGIWDEEFLQYMANNLDQQKEPFLSVVFTLTSHEPYPIPEKYSDQFFPSQPKILQTIAYTDFALRRFFSTAASMKWYKNTLFVICPDHTSIVLKKKFNNNLAKVSIPIIYFNPSDTTLRGNIDIVTQQLDIVPSVLDYLNYNKAYVSYGKSIFENGYRFSVSFNDLNYQIIDSSYCLLFDGEKTIGVNKYDKNNLSLSKNIANKNITIQVQLETYLKAFLEDYYFRINNNLLADTTEIN